MAKKKTNADGTPKRLRSLRLGDRRKGWTTVSGSVTANAADLPHAAIPLAALDKIMVEVDQISVDQAAFRASKQVTSQRLLTLFEQGDKLSTVLKAIVKQHYGNGNDKLVEFGIQPLRTRSKPTVVPPMTPAPTPEKPTSIPSTTPPSSK